MQANMLRHIPNLLTIMRLISIIPILLLLHDQQYFAAFLIFFIAGITDGLDGWLARRYQWQSMLGSILDPLADKLIVVCSFIALALIGSLPWWLVILVFARDLTICFGVICWFLFINKKLDFKPSLISKFNTTMQISLVTLCLFELAFFMLPYALIFIWIIVTSLTTTISYIDYVWTWSAKANLALKQRRYE